MRIVQSFGISLMLALSACAGSVSNLPALSTADANQYRLGPGDELRVIIPGLTEIENGTAFVVNDRGELTLPLMGGIPVKGSTIPELEQRVAALLVEKRLMVSPRRQYPARPAATHLHPWRSAQPRRISLPPRHDGRDGSIRRGRLYLPRQSQHGRDHPSGGWASLHRQSVGKHAHSAR